MGRFGDVGDSPRIGDKDVVVLNVPCSLALMETPFARFYHGQALPKTLRSLAPGCIGLQVERPDATTLIVRSSGPSLFYCRDVGPFDLSYVFWRINQMFQQSAFKRGYRAALTGLDLEVQEVDAQGLPAAVMFRFDASLNSPSFRWVYFDWKSLRFRELKIPVPGESIYILGPREG
jgi:hypothetical protein